MFTDGLGAAGAVNPAVPVETGDQILQVWPAVQGGLQLNSVARHCARVGGSQLRPVLLDGNAESHRRNQFLPVQERRAGQFGALHHGEHGGAHQHRASPSVLSSESQTKRQFMNTCNVKEGRQSGMTLIETLVALLVLSIGLLRCRAALQMTSLRNNHAAHTRSQATALAYDIADRMRANRTVAVGGG